MCKFLFDNCAIFYTKAENYLALYQYVMMFVFQIFNLQSHITQLQGALLYILAKSLNIILSLQVRLLTKCE